jgi:hypothetical protein
MHVKSWVSCMVNQKAFNWKQKQKIGRFCQSGHAFEDAVYSTSQYVHTWFCYSGCEGIYEYDLHKALTFLHFLLFFFLTSLDWSKCIASQMAGKLSFSKVHNVLTKSHQQCLQCLPGVSTVIAHIYIVNAKKC